MASFKCHKSGGLQILFKKAVIREGYDPNTGRHLQMCTEQPQYIKFRQHFFSCDDSETDKIELILKTAKEQPELGIVRMEEGEVAEIHTGDDGQARIGPVTVSGYHQPKEHKEPKRGPGRPKREE